jgi:hypothetical protein
MCGIMDVGLLYRLHSMVKCVCVCMLWIQRFRDQVQPFPNG